MASMYFTGGLEIDKNDINEIIHTDDMDYVLTDKFKTALRDSFIDWGTFLEIYNDNMNYIDMFDQIVKLLNIKNNDNIKDILLPLIEEIYNLPADAHIACMVKQFMLYEPLSITLRMLHYTIRRHFEHIVERFIITRNAYIINNNINSELNDWDKLIKDWNNVNIDYDLDSSSIVLLMLNPPHNITADLNFDIDDVKIKNAMDNLKGDLSKFNYTGFCPKVPHTRIIDLLKFPVNSFIQVIKLLAPDEKFPNYVKIEKSVSSLLNKIPKKPKISNDIKKETPPKELMKQIKKHNTPSKDEDEDISKNRLYLIKWFVNNILEYRKKLLPAGQALEKYYIESAKVLTEINELLKNELVDS